MERKISALCFTIVLFIINTKIQKINGWSTSSEIQTTTFDINDFKKYIHKNVARLHLR